MKEREREREKRRDGGTEGRREGERGGEERIYSLKKPTLSIVHKMNFNFRNMNIAVSFLTYQFMSSHFQ